jgi:ubiquitin carboxyl-terminal hydrolase 10
VEVMKKLSLEELPPVLILHLKCFVYNKDGGSQKLMKKVDYGIELEITKGNIFLHFHINVNDLLGFQ